MIKEFTKSNLRVITSEIESDLVALGKKHGITFKTAGGRFTGNSATLKLEVTTNDENGESVSKDLLALRRVHPQFENKEIRLNDGTKAKVVGYLPRARKYDFVVQTASGRRYRVTTSQIFG